MHPIKTGHQKGEGHPNCLAKARRYLHWAEAAQEDARGRCSLYISRFFTYS